VSGRRAKDEFVEAVLKSLDDPRTSQASRFFWTTTLDEELWKEVRSGETHFVSFAFTVKYPPQHWSPVQKPLLFASRALAAIFTRKFYDRVLKPTIMDTQLEYLEAPAIRVTPLGSWCGVT